MVWYTSPPAPSFVIGPPPGPKFSFLFFVKSGLISSHVVPLSVVLNNLFAA